MTYRTDYTLSSEFLSQIAEQGLDILPELIRTLINEAMRIERQRFLGVGPYERSPQRRGHANGYKPKTVATRLGKITFDVPQVRQGGFYPQSLEKGHGWMQWWLCHQQSSLSRTRTGDLLPGSKYRRSLPSC